MNDDERINELLKRRGKTFLAPKEMNELIDLLLAKLRHSTPTKEKSNA